MPEWLSEPFAYGFMRQALAGALLAGLNCSLIGVYIVLRRMAFISGALAHTILPGIVLAWMAGVTVFWGALGAGLVTALGVGWFSGRRVREDTAIGIILSAMFALGVLLMSSLRTYRDFDGLLFGSILGVAPGDLWLIGGSTAVVSIILILMHKELELSSVDGDYAAQIGARPVLMRYLVLVLAALSVVSAVKVVGALLTTALLIIPAATGAQVARSVPGMMAVSAATVVAGAIGGLLVSYHFDFSSGACIALVCAACFAVVWAGRSLADALSRRRQARAG